MHKEFIGPYCNQLFFLKKTSISSEAMKWVIGQNKEKKPHDKTIREKFNTYKFADYKSEVVELFQKVTTVSVKTKEIAREMEKVGVGDNVKSL